ncbi:MAG: competence protein ComEC family protein [Flavobacteriaceae bacterium]|nr:competence protein ComEC family protein [Flavobacteriaceae bacterium]
MLDLNYLPVHFSLFLILGIIIGYAFNFSLILIFTAALFSFSLLIYFYFKAKSSFKLPLFFMIFTGILFFLIGILSISIQKPQHQKKHYINHIKANNQTILRVEKILKPNLFYQRFEAKVIQMNNPQTKGKVLVNFHKDNLKNKVKVDDVLFTTNSFKMIRKALNPYQFNYQEYLKKQQIHHQLILKKGYYLFLKSNQKTLKGFAHSIREKINTELKRANFLTKELAIVNALLLGQKQGITKEQFEQYKNAGAIHILAVSGLHIGIILLILNFLFKPIEYLKNGKIIKLIIVVICLWVYAFLAGFSASVIRAVTMFTAIAISLASNRPFGVQNSLVISLFVLLLIHPLYLFNVGFQLSYVAVFSIVWLQPLFSNLWKPKFIITEYFWTLLTVSFAAQVGILPLSIYYFHQFPGLFFISSLVIIPFLGFILGIGFLVIILALFQIIPPFLVNIYGVIIKTMNNFVAFISHQENFIFQNISFSFLLMVVFYLLLISSVSWLKNKSTKNLYFVFTAVLLLQIVFIYKKYNLQKTNEFIVFHQSKNSLLGNKLGNKITIFQNSKQLKNNLYSPINSYKINFSNLSFQEKRQLKNCIEINSKKVLIIDSLGIYKDLNFKPEMVILTNSPKVNMARLLQVLQPKMIIADGSNYTSFVRLWEKSCKGKSIQFYNTAKNGAYVYNY